MHVAGEGARAPSACANNEVKKNIKS